MSTTSEPAAGVAAYRALQNEPMRAGALFGHLTAFEARRSRDLPAHLDPTRAPVRVFLFEAYEDVSFLAGPLGRMVSVTRSLRDADPRDAAQASLACAWRGVAARSWSAPIDDASAHVTDSSRVCVAG